MLQYKYVAKNMQGKILHGKMKAEMESEVHNELRKKGYRITQLDTVPETILNMDINIGRPINPKDFVIFLRQFTTIIRAGVTVIDGLEILVRQTKNKAFKKVLLKVANDIREGSTLSEASEKHPRFFPPMYINLIRAAELSGTLDETLERLALYFEKQLRTRQKIVSSMTYPAILTFVAIVVVILLLLFVVPTFVDLFESADAELSAITQAVLNMSNWVQSYGWTLPIVVIVLIVIFSILNKNVTFRYIKDYIKLRIPVFGMILQKYAIAQMTRTLSSLMSTSVPILQSLETVKNILGNEVLGRVIEQAHQDVEEGESMARAMEEHWTFPPLVTQMIRVGESTGALDDMLARVADFYEDEVDAVTDQFKALIEPFMILALAVIVGFIVASIMIPMFEMFNTIQ